MQNQAYTPPVKTLIAKDLKNIESLYFDNKTPVKNPRYIATAGGPGACKSTILEQYIENKNNITYLDPDQRTLRFMINTYYQSITNLAISKHTTYQDVLHAGYNKWRDASNYICKTLINKAYDKQYNIAHGATSTAPIMGQFYKKLQDQGCSITLLLCYAEDETRITSLKHRATTQGFIQSSKEDVVNKRLMFPERFSTYFQYADKIHLYWTDNFLKGSVRAATFKRKQKISNFTVTIKNENAYAKFKAKYDKDREGKNLPSLEALPYLIGTE